MKVAPTAMIAMKLASFARFVRFSARRNLFFFSITSCRFPSESSVKTRRGSPFSSTSNFGISTEPPKIESSVPSTKITSNKPASCSRRGRVGFCFISGCIGKGADAIKGLRAGQTLGHPPRSIESQKHRLQILGLRETGRMICGVRRALQLTEPPPGTKRLIADQLVKLLGPNMG